MTATLAPALDCDLEKLSKLLRRKPLLWVGAGMSMTAGYPSANGLIAALRDRALADLPPGDYCAVADAFLAAEGLGSLMDLLAEQFPNGKPATPWHHAAAQLYKHDCFANVVTTNYDQLLEHAFTAANFTYDVQTLDCNQELARPKRLFKIHGGIGDYQSLVLSRDSYNCYAKKYKFLRNQLEQLFIQQSILFVGCSMTDPRILDWLLRLSTKNRKKVKSWFALLTDSQIAALEQAQYGTDNVAAILAKIPFQMLRVRDFEHVPELFQQLAAQLAAGAVAPSSAAVASSPAATPGHRPTGAAAKFESPRLFVGREAQLSQLVAGLAEPDSSVIYQLQGSGGVGKSTLAQMAAASCQQHFERVLSFYMAEQTPQTFAVTLARELGQEVNEPGDDRAALGEISRLLGQGRYLLILDNLTNLETVANLLPVGTQTRLLITTRERSIRQVLRDNRPDLTVTTLEVALFSAEENLQLFQRVLGDDYRQQDETHYQAIGQTLGWLPVALRLAVSRMVYPPRWSAAELRAQVHQERLNVVDKVGNKGADDSLKSLQTVFQLDEKMTKSQRRALRHLAVCAEGPVPLSFMERFLGGNVDLIRIDLEELYDRSWCARSQGEEPMYELHVLVRELILQHETIPKMQERFLDQIHKIYTNETDHFSLKDRWVAQVQEAINKWQQKPDPRLVELFNETFRKFCEQRGFGRLLVALADLVLAKYPKNKHWCAVAMAQKALILWAWGRLADAYALQQKAEGIYESLGKREELASCYGNQALILQDWGRLEEAYALQQKAEAIYASLGNRTKLAACYGNQALILMAWGKLAEADALTQKQQSISEELGKRETLGIGLFVQGLIQHLWGKLDEALPLFGQAETIFTELKMSARRAHAYDGLARVYRDLGKLDEARQLHEAAALLHQQVGQQDLLAANLDDLALVFRELGDLGRARQLSQEALVLWEKSGNQPRLAVCLGNQAVLLVLQNEADAANTQATLAQEMWLKMGDRLQLAISSWNRGALAAKAAKPELAQKLWQQALDEQRAMGLPTSQWQHWLDSNTTADEAQARLAAFPFAKHIYW